jgi:hypothetical protein
MGDDANASHIFRHSQSEFALLFYPIFALEVGRFMNDFHSMSFGSTVPNE